MTVKRKNINQGITAFTELEQPVNPVVTVR